VPTVSVLQAPGPPLGSVEVATSPAGPTATQSDADGHEIAEKPDTPALSWVVRQAPGPPAGLVDVTTVPAVLTAAQNDADGHDRPVKDPSETLDSVHARGPPSGFLDTTTFPVKSTATQNLADAHDTDVKPYGRLPYVWLSTQTGCSHANGPPSLAAALAAGASNTLTATAANITRPIRLTPTTTSDHHQGCAASAPKRRDQRDRCVAKALVRSAWAGARKRSCQATWLRRSVARRSRRPGRSIPGSPNSPLSQLCPSAGEVTGISGCCTQASAGPPTRYGQFSWPGGSDAVNASGRQGWLRSVSQAG
jgi:hypothetical protein